jgi:hypothetical protein
MLQKIVNRQKIKSKQEIFRGKRDNERKKILVLRHLLQVNWGHEKFFDEHGFYLDLLLLYCLSRSGQQQKSIVIQEV